MIPALWEGMTQSLLPCSWTILLPAIALGLETRRWKVYGSFLVAVVLAAWAAVAGWLVIAVWVAGAVLLGGAVLWWRLGANPVVAAVVGVGSAWAWRPCVGAELGDALTTAQTDPLASFPGLAMFLVGVVLVGLAIGAGVGLLARRLSRRLPNRSGAVVAGLYGLTMVLGIYPKLASELARWSTELWA